MILSLFLRYVWQEEPVGSTLRGLLPAKHWVVGVLREQGSRHTGGWTDGRGSYKREMAVRMDMGG